MKRIVSLLFVAFALVALPMRAEAQIDLSKAFGALLGAPTAEQSAEKSALEIIAEQAPSSRDVVRTWGYERAYFDYLGSNPLAEVALQQLDTTVQAALKREGIVAGSFTLTLRRNGSGFIIWREHAVDGTYDYIEQKFDEIVATAKANGGNLYIYSMDDEMTFGVLNYLEAGASEATLADLEAMNVYISAIGGMQELYDVMAGTDPQSELAKKYFDDMMSMYFSPKMMEDIIVKGLDYLEGNWSYEVGSGEYQPTWIVDAENVANFEGFKGHA